MERIVADFSESSVGFVEKAAISLLAICPIVQFYRGVYVNAAVSILLVLFPYVLLKIRIKRQISRKNFAIILPLIFLFLFQVIDHGTSVTELGQAVVFIVYVIAIACGCLSTRFFMRVIMFIAMLASVCIIVQYFCYYVFHFHLQMSPTSLLLPRSQQWVLLAQTGRHSITGKAIKFYRPSAFFLEPSHMFIYMFTPTTIQVLSMDIKNRKEARRSLLLLLGMVMTTSGMGIVVAILLCLIYMGRTRDWRKRFSVRKLLLPKNLVKICVFLAVCFISYYYIPFVRNSVERVLFSGSDYSNAVSGRLDSGLNLISSMHGKQIILGVQDGLSGVTASMSGLNETMFQYGIIGVILSYLFYLRGLFKLRNAYFWIAVIIIGISLFTQHTHSTMFMIYSTFVFFEGYKHNSKDIII